MHYSDIVGILSSLINNSKCQGKLNIFHQEWVNFLFPVVILTCTELLESQTWAAGFLANKSSIFTFSFFQEKVQKGLSVTDKCGYCPFCNQISQFCHLC